MLLLRIVWLDLAALLPLLMELTLTIASTSTLEELLVIFSFQRIPWLLVGSLAPLLLVPTTTIVVVVSSELVVMEVIAHVTHAS